jgi:hypothetical protein
VEVFIKNRGKIKDMEDELGISYPTVVSRLNDVVRAMGYDINEEDLSEVDRFEYYQAQALNPSRVPAPRMPAPPAPPIPPIPPIPPMPPVAPVGPITPSIDPEKRAEILDELKAGKISAEEAQKKIFGN